MYTKHGCHIPGTGVIHGLLDPISCDGLGKCIICSLEVAQLVVDLDGDLTPRVPRVSEKPQAPQTGPPVQERLSMTSLFDDTAEEIPSTSEQQLRLEVLKLACHSVSPAMNLLDPTAYITARADQFLQYIRKVESN